MSVSRIEIDRLAIRVPGIDDGSGERLGRLVAERLAAGVALGLTPASFARLDLKMVSLPGESPDDLAVRIADRVAAVIAHGRGLEAGR